MRDTVYVRYTTTSVETNVLEKLQVNINETITLLELAFIAGLISEMNFSILKREYSSLRDSIEVKKVSRESRTDTIFSDSFFAPSGSIDEVSPRRQPTAFGIPRGVVSVRGIPAASGTHDSSDRKGHPNGQEEQQMSLRMSHKTVEEKNNQPAQGQKTRQGQYSPQPYPQVQVKSNSTGLAKDSRRNRIIKLIKDNREVTIKDIAFYFHEFSEKTIQRELVSLVESNVLKKIGERRWSRYSLV
jgi:hypothetical protein